MQITIITDAVTKRDIEEIARNQFGDMVKAVVDVEKKIMAVGGELHADEEAVLLENGSAQQNLWGINLYPEKSDDTWIEFNSMINVRPTQNNRSRGVEDPDIQEKIRALVKELVRV